MKSFIITHIPTLFILTYRMNKPVNVTIVNGLKRNVILFGGSQKLYHDQTPNMYANEP